jgi:hypothetical protein
MKAVASRQHLLPGLDIIFLLKSNLLDISLLTDIRVKRTRHLKENLSARLRRGHAFSDVESVPCAGLDGAPVGVSTRRTGTPL